MGSQNAPTFILAELEREPRTQMTLHLSSNPNWSAFLAERTRVFALPKYPESGVRRSPGCAWGVCVCVCRRDFWQEKK